MVCVDTNVLIDILRADVDTHELENRLDMQNPCVAMPTVFELWIGVLLSKRSEKEKRAVEALLRTLNVLEMGVEDAVRAAEIYVGLMKKGREIPPIDAMIAGVVIGYGEKLLTKDKHFKRVDGLKVEVL
jgi:predicted nucleic acid-binding protein